MSLDIRYHRSYTPSFELRFSAPLLSSGLRRMPFIAIILTIHNIEGIRRLVNI